MHIDRLRTSAMHVENDVVFAHVEISAGLLQLLQNRIQLQWIRIPPPDPASADRPRHQIGARLDPVATLQEV